MDGQNLLGPSGKALETFGNKQVRFRFRGIDLQCTLSHGLFSSADIDSGTRFLLKVLSKCWDEDAAAKRPLPAAILDAGCGTGLIGIAAAAALAGRAGLSVRCQDRDELARVFTESNAALNGISPGILKACTEALLSSPPGTFWDLIISNIPAKTGEPVLRDFVSRSAGLLNPEGRVFVVIVNPLSDMFRSWIRENMLPLIREEKGTEHTIFVYAKHNGETGKPKALDIGAEDSAYIRGEAAFLIEGQALRIRAFHGLADFDSPGILVKHAAKLIAALKPGEMFCGKKITLIFNEPGQGHLPLWLVRFLGNACGETLIRGSLILTGRNILSLEASRYNLRDEGWRLALIPLIDLGFPEGRLDDLPDDDAEIRLALAFPDLVPGAERMEAVWEGLAALLKPGDIALAGFPSSDAGRFDHIKPKGFTRLRDLKRDGFRVMAYART